MVAAAKPRLLFFNGPWDYLAARWRHAHIAPLRRLLEQDFAVVSVEGDCDFKREVEQHRPDVVLFHTGSESELEPEVTIRHTDAFPEVPRLGFMSRDPFSPSRLPPMNRLRAWGVDQVVTVCRPSDCPTPFFADTFYLPWWADDTVFRDYGEPKSIPISLTGVGWLQPGLYPWRTALCAPLLQKLPVYHVPPAASAAGQGYFGEAYARLLNRSLISAGCGSACRYFTQKLVEISATRACLLTEETEIVKAMGFRDGENCVFADSTNVVERVSALLADPARLQAIADAGHAHVHRHHTQRNRRLFAEWLELWRRRQPGERIVQVHPLEPLQLVAAETARPAATFPAENPVTAALVEGYRCLETREWGAAREKFHWVIERIEYVAEARLGAAISHLHQGRLPDALGQLREIEKNRLFLSIRRPDPVTLAYQVVAVAKSGHRTGARHMLAEHPDLEHPALAALRAIVSTPAKSAQRATPAPAAGAESANAQTLFMGAPRTFADWTKVWSGLLKS